MNPQPTQQAINAAVARVRQTTGNSSWRYSGGRWIYTRVGPNGALSDRTANAVEKARFDAILTYYKSVYPPPPPVPPARQTLRQRLFGQGATGSLNPIVNARAALSASVAQRGIIGTGIKGVSSVLSAGGAVLGGIGAIGKTILGAIAAPIKLAVGLVSVALALGASVLFGFFKTLSSIVREITAVARQITSIRNLTGTSVAKAQRGYNALRAGGMSGEAASSFLGNDNMRGGMGKNIARAYGLPDPTDPSFAAEFARKSQKMNIFAARQMADTLSGGSASPELLQLANTSPERLEREQKYNNRTQASLGVTPEMIRRVSDEFPLMLNRVSMFTEAIKTRFLATALPMMEKGMDWLTGMLQSKSGDIATAIQSGVKWLWVDGIQLIINGAKFGVKAFVWISNAILGMGDIVVAALRSFQSGQGGFSDFITGVANAVDTFFDIMARVPAVFASIGALVESALAHSPIGYALKKAGVMEFEDRSPVDAYNKAYDAAKPKFSIAGEFEKFRQTDKAGEIADTAESYLNAARDKRDKIASGVNSGIDGAEKFFGDYAQREAGFAVAMKEMTGAVKAADKNNVDALDRTRAEIAKNDGTSVLGQIKGQIARAAFAEGF